VGLVPVAFHRDTIPQQYKAQYQSYYDNGENVPIINATSMDQFLDYTGCQANDKDYLIGNDMECFGKLPPTYIVTCEFDPLRDDGKILEMALKEVGVPVKRDHYDGLPHCFWVFPTLPETQRFVANTFAGIGWVIGQM
jgi:versiconal hemiacetal acetate esterase